MKMIVRSIPMRLLVITSVYPRHAADDQVPWLRETCKRVAQSGVEVEILAPSWQGLASHTLDNLTVHRFRYGPAQWETLTGEEGAPSKLRRNPWLKLLAVAYLWCGFWKLVKLLNTRKYDLVEVHWPYPHAFMALPAVWAGLPVIYHYHSAELKLAAQNPLAQFIFARSLRWARAHVANSSYTANLVKKLHPRAEVQVISYGSPLGDELLDSRRTGPRRKLLFVGRHIERKGLTYLIQAMQQLPPEFSLTIVGEGDLTAELKAQALGNPRISFAGRLSGEELARVYASHDMFVLPAIVDSRGDTEGLGVVLIEAIAAGLPIVASHVGGIPDVIIDGQTGLLVEQKSPPALAQAIFKLSRDEALAQRLVAASREHALAYFSWGAVTRQTLALYKSVLRKTSIV